MATVTAYGVDMYRPLKFAEFIAERPTGREGTFWATVGGGAGPSYQDVIKMAVHAGLGMISEVFQAALTRKTLPLCIAQPNYGAASNSQFIDSGAIDIFDDDVVVATALGAKYSAPLGCVYGAAANTGMRSLYTAGTSTALVLGKIASAPVTLAGSWEHIRAVQHAVTGEMIHLIGASMKMTLRPNGRESRSEALRAAEIKFGTSARRFGEFRPSA